MIYDLPESTQIRVIKRTATTANYHTFWSLDHCFLSARYYLDLYCNTHRCFPIQFQSEKNNQNAKSFFLSFIVEVYLPT